MIQPVDVALKDGSTVRVREVAPADVDGLRELLGGMSENSRWLRFLSSGVDLDRMAAAAATSEDGVGLVVTAGAPERIVAHAMYVKETPARAEVAFEVADAWHGRGIATILLAHLAGAAARDGVSTFVAYVHPSNRRHGRRVPRVRLPGRGARLDGRARGRDAGGDRRGRAGALRGPRARGGGGRRGARARPVLGPAGDGRRHRRGRDRDAQPARGGLRRRAARARHARRGRGRAPAGGAGRARRPARGRARPGAGVRRRRRARARRALAAASSTAARTGASRLQALLAICRRNGMRLVGPELARRAQHRAGCG